jgi:serralysin
MWRLSKYLSAAALSWVFLAAMPVSGFIISPNDPDPWLSTASGSRSGNGAPATITWSIVPDGTSMSTGSGNGTTTSNLISFMNTNFGGSSAQTNLTLQPWFHILTDSFDRWEQLGGVDYVYESHDDGVFHPSSNGQLGVRGDIRLAGFNIDGASGTLAFTYIPTGGSDMAIDTGDATFFKNSTTNYINFRNTVMHELGHSFGLNHVASTTSNLLMEPFIDTSFDGPQLDEVRGVQYYFGDVNEKSNNKQGNGTPALATNLGTIAAGSTKSIGTAANVPTQAISAAATDFVSISNLNDKDYYSFTVSQPSLLSSTLTSLGGVFTQGDADAGATPTSFPANARNNLALTVLGTNGTSVLAAADAFPAGETESIANLVLPAAGTYYVRIAGTDDTIQLYELSLSPTAILLGDYNQNGVVDASDYDVWRKTMGRTVATGTGADGNFDGQITAADFNVWRSHFGQVGGSGSGAGADLSLQTNVPEPSYLYLLITGCILATTPAWCRRRRIRHIFR